VNNYFNYFTEIEERFQQRRGSLLLLSSIDWALIDTWRGAGVPLEAVLRGIDNAFDKYDARKAKSRVRRINGLAWCAQEVMQASVDLQEALVGAAPAPRNEAAAASFEPEQIATYLKLCAQQLHSPSIPAEAAREAISRLAEISASIHASTNLEELERTLLVLEEKLFAALLTATLEAELLTLREQAARELAPYRSRMQALQLRQIEQQFLHKRLLEKYGVPRLSLFYMTQA
jgi:hypothetical protein